MSAQLTEEALMVGVSTFLAMMRREHAVRHPMKENRVPLLQELTTADRISVMKCIGVAMRAVEHHQASTASTRQPTTAAI